MPECKECQSLRQRVTVLEGALGKAREIAPTKEYRDLYDKALNQIRSGEKV